MSTGPSSADIRMTPLKPHMVRAVYAWILENNLTPHILVDAARWGVQVPKQYIRDGKMVLNIEPLAVREFSMDNDKIHFQGRFHGVNHWVTVPMRAVAAIFAAENGRGQLFTVEDFEEGQGGSSGEAQSVHAPAAGIDSKAKPSADKTDQSKRPLFSVVPKIMPAAEAENPVDKAEMPPTEEGTSPDDFGGDDDPKPKKKKGSWLRVVK